MLMPFVVIQMFYMEDLENSGSYSTSEEEKINERLSFEKLQTMETKKEKVFPRTAPETHRAC